MAISPPSQRVGELGLPIFVPSWRGRANRLPATIRAKRRREAFVALAYLSLFALGLAVPLWITWLSHN
jgi:hypothetical protein